MSAVDLSKNVQYKRFKLYGKEMLFHSSVAYTTKREAERSANEARKVWDQPARIIKGKGGLYYLYVHGEE